MREEKIEIKQLIFIATTVFLFVFLTIPDDRLLHLNKPPLTFGFSVFYGAADLCAVL